MSWPEIKFSFSLCLAAHALECEQCGDRVYRDKVAALCEEGERLLKQDFAERWKELEGTEK